MKPKGKDDDEGGKGKGRGKDKGKGKGDSDLSKTVNEMRLKEKLQYSVNKRGKHVPECIRFNKGACKEVSCRHEHVCLRCGSSHPLTECDQPPVMK